VKITRSGDEPDYDNHGLRVMEFGRLVCWLGLYYYTLFLVVLFMTVLFARDAVPTLRRRYYLGYVEGSSAAIHDMNQATQWCPRRGILALSFTCMHPCAGIFNVSGRSCKSQPLIKEGLC
jgi:hypothetical protein